MFRTFFSIVLMLCFLTGCSSYNDYYQAGSDHFLNDRSRINSGQSAVTTMHQDVLSKIYASSPYLVEMIVYDAKGNPTPLKIKDTSRDLSATLLTMQAAENIEEINKPTPFTMKEPITIESVLLKAVDYIPWVTIPFMLSAAGVGDTPAPNQTYTADHGSGITVGGGSSSGAFDWIQDAFNTLPE